MTLFVVLVDLVVFIVLVCFVLSVVFVLFSVGFVALSYVSVLSVLLSVVLSVVLSVLSDLSVDSNRDPTVVENSRQKSFSLLRIARFCAQFIIDGLGNVDKTGEVDIEIEL